MTPFQPLSRLLVDLNTHIETKVFYLQSEINYEIKKHNKYNKKLGSKFTELIFINGFELREIFEN